MKTFKDYLKEGKEWKGAPLGASEAEAMIKMLNDQAKKIESLEANVAGHDREIGELYQEQS